MQSKKTKELIKRTQTLSLATAMLVTSLNFPVISVRAEDNEQTPTEIEQIIDETESTGTSSESTSTENTNTESTGTETESTGTENTNQTESTEDQTEENEEEVSDEVLDDEATTLADGEITATIIIDANGGTFADGSSQKTFNVEAGTGQYSFNFSLAEVPSASNGKNWTFKGWSESDSSEAHYSTDSTYSNFLSSGSTKTFYAAWGKSSQQTINRDYVFTDGAGHSETITKSETLMIDENYKLVSITYGDYLSTLSGDSDDALYRFEESIIRKYAAEASQQAVDGWNYTPTRDYYSDATLNNRLTMRDIRNNISTIYVKCTQEQATVTFKNYEGTELNVATTTKDKMLKDIKPAEPVRDNHLFLGWSTDGTEANIVSDTATFTSNTTLTAVYAEYNKVTYTLYNDDSTFPDGTTASKTYSYKTFIQGENNVVREALVSYKDMTPVIPTREGYIFCGWTSTRGSQVGDVTTDSSAYTPNNNFTMTSHNGSYFWARYNNCKDLDASKVGAVYNNTSFSIYEDVTVYPVWVEALKFNACGGEFANNQETTLATHDMLYDTKTNGTDSIDIQYSLWQDKCPVPTREGYQFVCWTNIKPISNNDFSNVYQLAIAGTKGGLDAITVNNNDWYAYTKNHSATAGTIVNYNTDNCNDINTKQRMEVYALWVPTYTKVIYHLDDMELDGTLQDNGLDGVTDYIDNSDPNDIKIIQYVPWYTDLNYQYSFKSNGRPLNVQWYKSRNFNVTEDYIGNLIPKQEKDIDVYAKQSINVTFDLNYDGHKQTKTFDKNTNITPIQDPEREIRIYNEETGTDDVYYYTFKGWYTNAECSGSVVDFNNLKATKETTYYAKWVEPKINHTVTFIDDVDGSTIDTKTVERNKTVTKPTYTGGNSYFYQDLMFLGWSETGSRYNLFDFTTPITGNKTLHAVYADAVTIEFIDSYNGQTVEIKKIAKDSKVSEPSFRGNDPDRRFVGWSFIGTADDLFDFKRVISNSMTLYSAYAEPLPKYTVTFKDSLGPEFEVIESKIVTENDRVEAPVFNHGHPDKVLIGWSKTRNDTDNLFDFNTGITSDIELFAVYKDSSTPVKQTFTVTFNTDGGSLVSNQTVEKGNKVVKPANPTKEGYTFDCWTLGLLEFNFNTAINQNITLTARWTRNPEPSTPVVKHTVKFIDWDGRVVEIQQVDNGKNAKAPATPAREGYTFTGWDKSLNNVTSDMEIKAQYKKNETEKPVPTEPTKPEPTKPEPTPVEPTQPKDEEEIIPIIEDEPESEEEPTDSEEEELVEDNIIPEIVVNEVTPEDDPAPIYVGDNDSDKETNATALGKFVEAVKVITVTAVISLAALLGLLGLLILILLWMKRVKVLNNKNTDEYNEEKFEVVYRTSVKSEGNLISELQKQENRVWTITIPDEIINERVTDEFRIELKKLFCKRYNGEQLIIKLGESEDARQIGKTIDEKENTVEFTFTE